MLNRKRGGAEKSSEGGRWVGREHETLADEESVEAGVAEFGEVVVSAEAGFADRDAGLWDALDEFERGLDAQVQSLQIAIVDADDAGFRG